MMYKVNIDFDDASVCWRANKKYLGGGQFSYICNYIHSNNKQCRGTIYSNVKKNNYIYGFGGQVYDKYVNHRNKDFFCKRHLNRYNKNY
jgi:hypothetical protein